MAATSSNAATTTVGAGENSTGSNVPQWKRDLIQRRRQQNKVFTTNVNNLKLCSALTGTSNVTDPERQGTSMRIRNTTTLGGEDGGVRGVVGNSGLVNKPRQTSSLFSSRAPIRGAIAGGNSHSGESKDDFTSSVACNMRLEADLTLCPSLDVEDGMNSVIGSGVGGNALPNKSVMEIERNQSLEHAKEDNKNDRFNHCDAACEQRTNRREMFGFPRTKTGKLNIEMDNNEICGEDDESDSSEELQYGPGIVNKLKSKYLNLTLREMNKNRASVQCFRRAASLEDLLDCDDNTSERITKRYTKKNNVVPTVKTDRYRNASRGNDTMKRARSVETLMRYNMNSNDEGILSNRFISSNGLKQETGNDHIILIDRTSVKIENRLEIDDRPKAINKPKRIKPVLAETERPPPDLVKTTMRIFEGSTKKLKPKGEVAAKIATFKTINDTFKAQNQKKLIIPKSTIQPKPFTNGTSRSSSVQGSPVKKIVLPQKPMAELIENDNKQEEFHVEGVDTDSIARSVSSVVSKFQNIEKSHSPSSSPEPSSYKLKFSPTPSPEPQFNNKQPRPSIEIKCTQSAPRILSPRIQSPPSPLIDCNVVQRQNPSPVNQLPFPSSLSLRSNPSNVPQQSVTPMVQQDTLSTKNSTLEQSKNTLSPSRIISPDSEEKIFPQESLENNSDIFTTTKQIIEDQLDDKNEIIALEINPEETKPTSNCLEKTYDDVEEGEQVDGLKTISKSALENINKAGTTLQFNFNDESSCEKDYLPGIKQNGNKFTETEGPFDDNTTSNDDDLNFQDKESKIVQRIKETSDLITPTTENNKPIGAICSLGLIKCSTTTSYPQSNESKTIKSSKTDPPQKQIGIIRPLVSTKIQHPQQNLSNRELEKNLINRVKSIEQPTKVVVSLKSADEIQPTKKASTGSGDGGGTGGGSGGLWDTKPWNQQNNTMVFNFSNRRDVPDYIENDGLIIRRKRDKPKVGDGGIIVLDATLDASTTDDAEWEISVGPPSPCDVSFINDNVLINGRSNLSRTPRNHNHRIQFDDTATRTFEYPSEASMLEGESSNVDGETTSCSVEQSTPIINKTSSSSSVNSSNNLPSLLGGGGLASYTPSKVDLTSEGFELGVTRAVSTSQSGTTSASSSTFLSEGSQGISEVDYLKPAQDAGAWGSETTGDLLY